MGPELHLNPYHVPLVRARLTRNLEALYPEVRDEICAAFEDALGLEGNGAWFDDAVAAADGFWTTRMEERAGAGRRATRGL